MHEPPCLLGFLFENKKLAIFVMLRWAYYYMLGVLMNSTNDLNFLGSLKVHKECFKLETARRVNCHDLLSSTFRIASVLDILLLSLLIFYNSWSLTSFVGKLLLGIDGFSKIVYLYLYLMLEWVQCLFCARDFMEQKFLSCASLLDTYHGVTNLKLPSILFIKTMASWSCGKFQQLNSSSDFLELQFCSFLCPWLFSVVFVAFRTLIWYFFLSLNMIFLRQIAPRIVNFGISWSLTFLHEICKALT